jgi:hypothetical protein
VTTPDFNDPRAYDQFISITADGGNIGTLNWRNAHLPPTTGARWLLGNITARPGTFRWTTPKWVTVRVTRGVARYTPVLWNEPTAPW